MTDCRFRLRADYRAAAKLRLSPAENAQNLREEPGKAVVIATTAQRSKGLGWVYVHLPETLPTLCMEIWT